MRIYVSKNARWLMMNGRGSQAARRHDGRARLAWNILSFIHVITYKALTKG
jgi:hypothetical protein